MVRRCFRAHGMGSLDIWGGTVNAEQYIQVLKQHMLPSRQRLHQGPLLDLCFLAGQCQSHSV